MRVVAPFQPTCFPPAYIFQRALTADCVVLMESAQMTPFSPAEDGTKKRTWQKHLRLGGTSPVADIAIPTTASMQPINETPLDTSTKWRDTLIKTLNQRYPKATDRNTITDLVAAVIYSARTLAELNSQSLRQVVSILRIPTEICTDSICDKAVKGDWVISLVKSAQGDTLLTGKPSTAYMNTEHFAKCGVSITVQNWAAKPYQHYGNHQEPMSILHTLYSLGINQTADWIRQCQN